jgi:ribonuclease P protein component
LTKQFPKRVRILRASDFERVFAARSSAADTSFVLHAAVNEEGYARLGLVVSRRVGKAVARNQWKRRLREAFRLSQNELPAMDFVCIPRAGSPPTLAVLQKSFAQLASRIERRARRKLEQEQEKPS